MVPVSFSFKAPKLPVPGMVLKIGMHWISDRIIWPLFISDTGIRPDTGYDAIIPVHTGYQVNSEVFKTKLFEQIYWPHNLKMFCLKFVKEIFCTTSGFLFYIFFTFI
jgi:hypothetical protein